MVTSLTQFSSAIEKKYIYIEFDLCGKTNPNYIKRKHKLLKYIITFKILKMENELVEFAVIETEEKKKKSQ